MSDGAAAGGSRRVLALPPNARDAAVAARILIDAGFEPRVCETLAELCEEASRDVGAVVIAEERLASHDFESLIATLERQPPWSDLPLIVLMLGGARVAGPLARLNEVANLKLVARPLRVAEFVSAVQTSLRDRARQYAVRDFLAERERAAEMLRTALAGASAANLAKSQFLANMSHEIRTPMTAVLGYADLLAARETDPEKSDFLDVIKRNGRFLIEIVDDILDLSKIEVGKMELQFERISPQMIAGDVRSLMDVRAKEKGVDLLIEFDGQIPEFVESDPKRLRQILINLVGNAIKFTDEGTVRLILRHRADGGESKLEFRVVDTGVGMTPEQRSRLFRPFSQGDASVTRSFGGTGLGLAISQRLAEMLGGTIAAASEAGAGSEFAFDIPVGSEPTRLVTPSPDLIVVAPGTPAETVRLDCRALIVDDRRDVRTLARHILTRAGAEVEFAEDGIEAIETVRRSLGSDSTFDVVLLDMQMPRLDGYETAVRLRRLGFAAPIIALTADAMHGDRDRCLANGCNAYLAKPIDAAELISTVAELTT